MSTHGLQIKIQTLQDMVRLISRDYAKEQDPHRRLLLQDRLEELNNELDITEAQTHRWN